MTTWLMVATSAHLAPIVVEHQRRLHVVGEPPAHAKLGSPAGASDITARFPLPQVRGTAIFPPIFLERQTSSDPYLSIYLSRRVGLGQLVMVLAKVLFALGVKKKGCGVCSRAC